MTVVRSTNNGAEEPCPPTKCPQVREIISTKRGGEQAVRGFEAELEYYMPNIAGV